MLIRIDQPSDVTHAANGGRDRFGRRLDTVGSSFLDDLRPTA
jgi:hypothetical protein